MSTPHDFMGRELEPFQLVVTSLGDADKHLCFGLVEHVNTSTGCVDVRLLEIDSDQTRVERFAYPANQLLSMGITELNRHNPYHKRLIDLINQALSAQEP